MRTMVKTTGLTAVMLLVFVSAASIKSRAGTGVLSSTKYVDPNGYFTIYPPAGWRIQKYPGDPRGKVAFHGPNRVELRVLAKAVHMSSYDELVRWCRSILPKMRRLGVTDISLTTVKFLGLLAVKRTFSFRGLRFLYMDFLVGKVSHNLAYGTPTKQFDRYLKIVSLSMKTYQPRMKQVKKADILAAVVASKKRLAQLMFKQGKLKLALYFVRQGLEVAPKDPGLLGLKTKIESKLKK